MEHRSPTTGGTGVLSAPKRCGNDWVNSTLLSMLTGGYYFDLVGGLEHFLFFHWEESAQLTNIFRRG
jgi:hypothetical protein